MSQRRYPACTHAAMPSVPVSEASVPLRHFLFLVAVAALGFWSQIGSVPLFDLDEGAFSEATVEMVHDGDYLATTLNGEPRYDKPILIYWLQAASINAFGVDEFAFRLPSAICATLWLLLVYQFAFRCFQDRDSALLAASSLGLSIMAGLIGHAAIADALLNFLLAGAMLALFEYSQKPSQLRLLKVFGFVGFGFLAKGPIAIALPLAVGGLYFVWQRRSVEGIKAALNPLGWLLAAAIIAIWVVPLVMRDHGVFLYHFIFDHNIGRYGSTLQGHGGKVWYYFAWLPVIVAPFTALIPGALARARRAENLDGFLLIWFLVVFIVFSFSGTQLPHYLLYGCTPLFILFGRQSKNLPARLWLVLPSLVIASLLAALPWVLPMVHVPDSRSFEGGILALAVASFGKSYYLVTFAMLGACLACAFLPKLSGLHRLLGSAVAIGIALWFGAGPVFAAAQQGPVREAAERARELKLPVVSYRTYLPSFSVYRGEPTPTRTPHPGELVFLRLDRIPDLQAELGKELPLLLEFRRGGVALMMVPPLNTP